MLKNPVVVEDQRQGKGSRSKEHQGPEGTARLAHEARLVPRSTFDGGTAIPERQERSLVMDEHKISELFRSYFNNKMTLLLFLVQAKNVTPNPKLAETVRAFLDDLFRHMLEDRLQKRYRLIFKWLKRFFEMLPAVSVYQRDKAKDFIRAIYDAFGLHLKDDI
jgi:hypothetical protein